MFPVYLIPAYMLSPPLSTFPTRKKYLLKLINTYRPAVILQSRRFTFQFSAFCILWVWTNTMTWAHHYRLIWSVLTALTSCALPTYSFSPKPNLWPLLIFLLCPQFCLFLNVIQLESHSMLTFQIGFFYLVICIKFSHVFSWLENHFLLMLNNILLSGCTMVSLSIYTLKDIQ